MSVKGSYVVTKSNLLIDARQRNPLGLQEWRIVLSMISQIQLEDKEFETQKISVKEFSQLIDHQEPDYKAVKKVCESLMGKWLDIPQPNGGWLLTQWISAAEYIPGEGVIEFTFSQKLKPYLLDMKDKFTTYKLGYVLLLRSVYGIKLYEIAKMWSGAKSPNAFKYELDEFKKILGVGEDSYPLYADFKRRAIIPAIKEINEKTDLTLDFKEIKKGRKVVALDFKIKFKAQKKKPQNQLPSSKSKPSSNMFGRSKQPIREELLPDWFDDYKAEQDSRRD